MKLIKLTEREKEKLFWKSAVVMGMIIIAGMLFNIWSLHDRIDAMSYEMEDWKHLIEFLKIWVRENGLTIKPPGTGV